MSELPPLSLYIHFPWCVQKCPYCDFNSHALRNNNVPEEAYVDQLIRELDYHFTELEPRPLHSLFLGGGTPSLFSASAIERLLSHIKKITHTPDNTEVTMEANPGTLTNQKHPDFLAAGINRLSVGVQSFNSDQLRKLGRIHNPNQAIDAIEQAALAGFKRINADLMFGLPQQSAEQALADIKQAMELPISHLSWYQLTLEPNTQFYRFPPSLPDDDQLITIQEQGQAAIQAAGFEQYEVSAYAKNADYCRHNMNYWQFGDYLGIGAGAHSKITQNNGQIMRYHNEKHPKRYAQPSFDQVVQRQVITKTDIIFEFFLNACRLNQPIAKKLFSDRAGLALDQVKQPIEQAKALAFIEENPENWQVTPHGRLFLNDLLQLFLA
jgi:oxygen-independent coproporphyrinogen-3 oxidase